VQAIDSYSRGMSRARWLYGWFIRRSWIRSVVVVLGSGQASVLRSGQVITLVYRLGVLVQLLMAFTGCSEGVSARGYDPALADTLSSHLIADAYDFGRVGTLERMTALYADSEGVVSASGGQMTVSADSVRQGIARFWEEAGRNMRDARWTWHEVQVERLAEDAAVLTGTWSIPHLTPDGQPHVIEGAWTAVFRRMDGEWKIVQEHLSEPE
jgi:ketosteroid isomerase-like protein